MRILIGGSSSKFFHLKEFGDELVKFGAEYRLVNDIDYCDGFPSRRISSWFNTKKKFHDLVSNYKPDLIFVDRQRHFGQEASKTGIPLLVHLRGDFWTEFKWAGETLYRSFPKKIALMQWEKIGKMCFENSSMILPICSYLEKRTKQFYPNKVTKVMYQGINPERWFDKDGLTLKHPCVGLLQSAVIWGKTKEMLTLKKVLEKMPEIMFYWVGDGPYRNEVLEELKKYENFKWLGSMQYPDKVREYLTEIDIYALISGIDMSPLTLQEAQLMKKPVIATNVGGIPELMKDDETGFLVEKCNPNDLIEKIGLLINDEVKANQMGNAGRRFIEKNFSWEKIARKFLNDVKPFVN